jgi:hypothetical protein
LFLVLAVEEAGQNVPLEGAEPVPGDEEEEEEMDDLLANGNYYLLFIMICCGHLITA